MKRSLRKIRETVAPADSKQGRTVRTQIILASCLVLVPMVVALGFLVYQLERTRQATLAVQMAYEAIDVGHRLKAQFADVQMAVHAYVLTGEESFLTAYRQGRREWSEAEMAASGLIRRRPERTQRRFIEIEEDVDEFFMDWEARLVTLQPGTDNEEVRRTMMQDRERVKRISDSIATFVDQEEAEIRQLLDWEQAERRRAYAGLLLTSVLSVLLLGVFAFIVGRSIARPIRQVSDAAVLLGEGHWEERVVPRGGRETRALANAFNQMADALQEARDSLAARNRELEETTFRLAMLNDDLRDRQKESEDFLYVLSHDLRAPLINIQGFSRRLQNSMKKLREGWMDGGGGEEAERQFQKMEESLNFINAGTAKIDQLIARLLEIARLTTRPNEPRWIDMNELVRDVVSACQFQLDERGIEVEIDALPHVFGDAIQLNQVVTNLVDNAIKYMGERTEKRITVTCSVQGDRYCFAVRDTGPGISRENREKVFRMFSRLAPDQAQGEGIGLAAVRTIVNRHRGRIWVESTEGEGSTFYFTLPKNPEGAPPPPTAEGDADEPKGEGSVIHD